MRRSLCSFSSFTAEPIANKTENDPAYWAYSEA